MKNKNGRNELEERIRLHNKEVILLQRDVYNANFNLEQKLREADNLRFDEIMNFVNENGYTSIWIMEEEREPLKVFVGNCFETNSISFTVSSIGYLKRDRLFVLLSSASKNNYRISRLREVGNDFWMERALVFEF